MADADLLSYIGAISGVIGAVTGLAGATVAYISYRKTEKLKSLDLRLELRKAVARLQAEVDELPALVDRTEKSRMAVASATGMLRSGAMTMWEAQWEADRKSIEPVQAGVKELNIDHAESTPIELEAKLVEAHGLQSAISRLKESCASCLAEDDRQRNHLREDLRARTRQ